MKNNTKSISGKSKKIFVILVIIEFFNALSGLAGGFGLISDPTAASLGMDVSWLEGTPFGNYLFPGIVLFTFNGIGNFVAAILTLRKSSYFPEVGLFFGLIMMIWIISQVAWIGFRSFLQPLYFFTGVLQAGLASRIMIYRK